MTKPIDPYPPIKVEHLYSTSHLANEAADWKPAIEKMLAQIRSLFIFDNVVIYWLDEKAKALEVVFAKATGRGKSREADVSWGEALANQIVQENRVVNELPAGVIVDDRLKRPLTLGIPLRGGDRVLGAIIFIRFGTPEFTQEHIEFGHYVAEQLTAMIERNRLRQRLDDLGVIYQLFQLQEDFIATLSHEIRNPLGFIKGYTTTLLRPNTHWEVATQQEFLTIIDKETDRLQELIENLLDSARLQSGHMKMDFQPVRVDALINDVVSRAEMHHPEVKISTEMDGQMNTIFGDPRRLAQVFENLISNAIKYAPGSPVHISLEEKKNGVQISFRDEGPGIPEKYLSQLFQRFYRVPERSIHVHGSGLGLFICKQIVDAHLGEITVSSTLNQGTTFHIFIPTDPSQRGPK